MIDKATAKERIATNLRRLIAARGWTVADLVRESHEAHNTVYRIIRGENVPDAVTLANLADVLDTSIDRLLQDIPEKFSLKHKTSA